MDKTQRTSSQREERGVAAQSASRFQRGRGFRDPASHRWRSRSSGQMFSPASPTRQSPSRARRNTVATLQQQPPRDSGTGGNILSATGPTSARTRRRHCQRRLPQGVPAACDQTDLLLAAAPARRCYPHGLHRDGRALRRGLKRWAHADHARSSRGLPLRWPAAS
jgi:hypothetical protein